MSNNVIVIYAALLLLLASPKRPLILSNNMKLQMKYSPQNEDNFLKYESLLDEYMY